VAIALRGLKQGDVAGPGSTVAITLPTGTTSTDVIIVSFGSDDGSAVGTWSAPAGWTPLFNNFTSNNGSSYVGMIGFWALGSVSNLTFTKSGVVNELGWLCTGWTGVDNSTPIDATGTTSSTNSNTASITANSVTPVTTGALELICLADWNSGTLTSSPSTLNFILNGNTAGTAAASNASADLCYGQSTLTGGVSSGTFSITDAGSSSGQILLAAPFALRPVAVPTISKLPLVIGQSVAGAVYF